MHIIVIKSCKSLNPGHPDSDKKDERMNRINTDKVDISKYAMSGDVVTFYQGIRGLTNSEVYSSGYYLELMAKKRDELLSVVEPQGDVGKQLSLF